MEITTATATKTCECGCGAEVARRFLPGHDAKLKGRLLAETRSSHWWIRESAIDSMIERHWGHFIDPITLACARQTTRFNGKFVQSRHIETVGLWNLDQDATVHSHNRCPAIEGKVRKTADSNEGWICHVCTHTKSKSEVVAEQRFRCVAFK